MRRGVLALALLAVACGGGDPDSPFGLAPTSVGGTAGGDDGSGETGSGDGSGGTEDAGTEDGLPDPDATDDATTDAPPTASECTYESTSFGEGMLELDVPPDSPLQLTFFVPGLPDPALVESATLRFDSYDADHPGEEGTVWINGAGPYDLPADAAWDNADGSGTLDVTGALVAGSNEIAFGPGPLERSFFRIGNVALDLVAAVEDCEPPPDGPVGNPVPRQVDYQDAEYTMRHNWVLRCNDYAFTAHGDEHLDSDCEGLYAPDGTRRGTASFFFGDVEPGTYEIQIRSRHTVNRNPAGALFVVDGEGKRIDQRDDADYTTDVWGTRDLEGDVTVVLDSSQESESDSVIWVRLQPV